MKTFSYFLAFCLASLYAVHIGYCQNKLSAGAAHLFKNVKTAITPQDKENIFTSLKVKLVGNSYMVEDMPVEVVAYPTDMNKDGKEEIFIVMRSSALFGMVGEGFMLFMKDASGAYRHHDEVGGGMAVIMSTANKGFPDILIGGPGFDFPVYRWNGSKYTYFKNMKDGSLTNDNSKDIDSYSKAFTN